MEKEQIEKEISLLKQKTQLTKKERRRLKKIKKHRERLKRQRDRKLKKVIKIALFIIIIVGAVGGIASYLAKQPKIEESEIVSKRGLHWHPTLTIIIKGEKKELPKDIGIGVVHQPIHTHDSSGTIHMEMKGIITKDETRLDRFFEIWGQKFSSECIFDNCNGEEGQVKFSVNGEENKEFENYLMKDGDKIEIRYE